MNEHTIRQALHQIAEQEVSENMNLWPHIQCKINPPAKPVSRRLSRMAFATAISLGVMLLMFLTVPPLRTFAQQIARQIGAVSILFIDPSESELTLTDPDGQEVTIELPHDETANSPDGAVHPMVAIITKREGVAHPDNDEESDRITVRLPTNEQLSIEEASAKVEFPVYQPGAVPEGYTLAARFTLPTPNEVQPDVQGVHTIYALSGAEVSISTTFELIQHRFQPGKENQMWMFLSKDTSIQDITVRGQRGVWVEGKSESMHALLWEENGFTFMLQSSILTQAELLSVAESLAP